MKKLVLVITILVFSFSMNAQSFGAKAGLNISNISGDATDSNETKVGLALGAVAEFKLSEIFAFQPEIVYSSQGVATKDSKVKLKMNYLNVPLIAKYYPTENLSLQLGPQIGFLVSAKVDDGERTVDVDDNLKTIDLGLSLGLGYKLDSGLFFDARYNFGLSDINDYQTNNKNHNSVINFSVGYFFN